MATCSVCVPLRAKSQAQITQFLISRPTQPAAARLQPPPQTMPAPAPAPIMQPQGLQVAQPMPAASLAAPLPPQATAQPSPATDMKPPLPMRISVPTALSASDVPVSGASNTLAS
jgi:hypothetical protein